jgi:hypothetical protein
VVYVDESTSTCTIERGDENFAFTYDRVFEENALLGSSQARIWAQIGKPMLAAALAGFNATLFCYGQTGTGKTHTMIGGQGEQEGLVPRTVRAIFAAPTTDVRIEASLFEIAYEKCHDLLLAAPDAPLRVRQHPQKGFFVEGLSTHSCTSMEQMLALVADGAAQRLVGATAMNAASSRSHSVFKLRLTTRSGPAGPGTSSVLNIIDLAGSEDQRTTGATGERLRQGAANNLSLHTLGQVISALAHNSDPAAKKKHVPYRDSVLTQLLEQSLGGNARTFMLATVSPDLLATDETLSTLRYASRAKLIKNSAVINKEPGVATVQALRAEIEALRAALSASAVAAGPAAEQAVESERAQLRAEAAAAQAALRQELEAALAREREEVAAWAGRFTESAAAGSKREQELMASAADQEERRKEEAVAEKTAAAARIQELETRVQQEAAAAWRASTELARLSEAQGKAVQASVEAQHRRAALDAVLVSTLPLCNEANALAVELGKGLSYELTLQPGTKVEDCPSLFIKLVEAVVDVAAGFPVPSGGPPVVPPRWTHAEFCTRLVRMRDVHGAWVTRGRCKAEGPGAVDADGDPFTDAGDVLLGHASIFLAPLRYGMAVEESVPLLDQAGVTRGQLDVHVFVASPDGEPLVEAELQPGVPAHVAVHVLRARGLPPQWAGLRPYVSYDGGCEGGVRKLMGNTGVEGEVSFSGLGITAHEGTRAYLDSLASSALVLQVWGQQKAPLPASRGTATGTTRKSTRKSGAFTTTTRGRQDGRTDSKAKPTLRLPHDRASTIKQTASQAKVASTAGSTRHGEFEGAASNGGAASGCCSLM